MTSVQTRTRILTTVAALASAGALVASAGQASAAQPGPAFWVDGTAYGTVGTPSDFSGTGAPQHSYDTIYQLHGAQPMNIATAAPGDTDFNGGRWQVVDVQFPDGFDAALSSGDLDGDGVLTSDQELHAAVMAGDALIGGVLKSFLCPVIPLGGHA